MNNRILSLMLSLILMSVMQAATAQPEQTEDTVVTTAVTTAEEAAATATEESLATEDTQPADAEAAEEPAAEDAPPPLDSLLIALTDASLSETQDILNSLEAIGGKDMLPMFQTMLEGDLYYDEDSLEILSITEDSAGEDVGRLIFADQSIVDLEAIETSKIRVNNRLRGHLRLAISRVLLSDGSEDERKTAVRNLLSEADDEETVMLLEQALETETSDKVIDLINTGIALYTLQEVEDPDARIAALDHLTGRLEAPVRNLLNRYLSDSAIEEQDPAFTAEVETIMQGINSKIKMYDFFEQVFFGLSLGSVLLLVAIGLAVTFGVMGVINMAHGEMLMLGAYTTFVIQQAMPTMINASIWVSIPAAFVVAAAVGILIQQLVIKHLNGRPLETLLATFGISLILQQAVRTIFSPLNRRVVSPDWLSGSWEINPVFSVTYNRLFILIFAIIIFLILRFILNKTNLGLNVRAVSQNRSMAKAMGIKTGQVDALTFGLGSGIAGIAGVALSQLTNVGPNLGQSYIIDSFMVVVFGGVGNLLGTMVGAFSLGVANKFLEPVTGSVLAKILVLVFIILFIQKRPKGLFPQKGRAAE